MGNKRYALKLYIRTLKEISDCCKANQIHCIILGPNRRNSIFFEPAWCRKLDTCISKRTDKQKYISGYEQDAGKKMNQQNGIHASQDYHDLIAEKIYRAVYNRLPKPENSDAQESTALVTQL